MADSNSRITDALVRSLRARGERYEVSDPGRRGFRVRVTERGTKSFVYAYRFGGRQRRLTLGRYPKMTLAQAHIAHANACADVERGIDPGQRASASRDEARRAPTVSALALEFIERRAKIARPGSWQDDARMLERDVLPHWGERKARDITRRDAALLLDGKVDALRAANRASKLVAANRLLWLIKRMFDFAVERDIVAASPCWALKPVARERPRERILSEDEIGSFLSAVESTPMSEPVRLALRIALLTAQRRSEIACARRSEFDLVRGIWSIPAERTKSGRAHTVPLSPMAVELVGRAMDLAGASEWLFPSPVEGLGHIEPHALSTAVIRLVRVTGIQAFSTHDLRRTAASHMTGLGFPRLVVAKVLNHSDQGAIAVYDRYGYSKEKRQALDAWAIRVGEIANGVRSNVVVSIRRN